MTLALADDIDAIAENADLLADGLADAPAATARALHLDHRVPGAQGQPRKIKDWGDLVQARRPGHHAQPEDLGRRALELSGGLGLCAEGERRRRGQGAGSSWPISTATCRCSTPARAARPPPSPSAASATCCWPGRTRPSSRSNEFGPDKFEIVVPQHQHPGRAAGGGGRQECRRARHARGGRGLSAVPLLARRRRRSRPSTTIARAIRRCRRKYQSQFPEIAAGHHRRRVRRLAEGAEASTSPTAASSTRSIDPDSSAAA